MSEKILIIDDDADMCALLAKFLIKKGYTIQTAHSGHKGLAKLKEESYDIVVCDYRLGDMDGNEVLREVKLKYPETVVLIITGYSDIKTAVDVMKMGAFDYISKPLIPDEVLNVLNKATQRPVDVNRTNRDELGYQKRENDCAGNGKTQYDYLAGESAVAKELYRQVDIVAPTNYSVILFGESGTGKEVIAKTIHEKSDRWSKPFIAMDCGTLSRELAASELFGHVKGSFTGALTDKTGHFELANGGTLFLDEVANLSYEIQASLLRVLQERKFKRVGGTKEVDTDVRIIVASNENLQNAFQKGKFREDLYHRLNEFIINLPPLRERKLDIPLFADFFLQKTNAELGKDIKNFDEDVLKAFINYTWPGNLREFRNVIRRASLLTTGNCISVKTLPEEIANAQSNPAMPIILNQDDNNKQADLKNASVIAEYDTIMKVLKEVKNNKSKAAQMLNIDRKTLYNKIRQYEELKH